MALTTAIHRPVRALDVAARTTTVYPAEFATRTEGRAKRALGNLFDLDQFGVNLTTLTPGAATALRHWHSDEDEFVFVLDGTVTLVTDTGEQVMAAGDCIGFKAGLANGHLIRNTGDAPALLLEIGTRRPDIDKVTYPDDDLVIMPDGSGKRIFRRKDGSAI